jgi:hypothetical protein
LRAGRGILEHFGENFLGFTDTDGIGVFRDLVSVERGVRATHEDGDAAFPEPGRDLVAAQRRDGPDGNGDDVDVGIEIDLFGRVID